ncbi:MAG: hypothetical protein QXM31_03555 [Candidatus Woesearchaeota archaeon]
MRWAMALTLVILLLAACKPVETQEIIHEPAVPVVEQPPATMPVVEQPPVAEPVVEQPPATVPAAEPVYERPPEQQPTITGFLSQYKNEVKDYKFNYKNDAWAVQGNYARIKLFRVLQNIYQAPYIDTVYLDLERRTAVGVCVGYDDKIRRQCADRQTLGRKYALPYVQFKIMLPHDWLFDKQNLYFTIADTPKLVTSRQTVHLKHQSQARVIDLYIDPSSGLPVAAVEDGTEYHYENLAKNQLGSESLKFE